LCNEKWSLDLAFLVDVISHVSYLNLKLQGKDKLFPSLVNDISVFTGVCKGGLGLGLKKTLELDILEKFYYLRKGD